MTMEEMVTVEVMVPRSYVGELYKSAVEIHTRAMQIQAAEPVDTFVERTPWKPGADDSLARQAWSMFPERARAVFGTLMDHPGKKFSGDELAEMNNIPNGRMGVAGVLAWPGRNLAKLGRLLPLVAESNPAGGSWYSMDPQVAKLFKVARDQEPVIEDLEGIADL